MKRFQRVNAFILALVLLLSVIPVGALPAIALDAQSAQDLQLEVGSVYLHASYSSGEITLDGNMAEAAYQRSTFIPGGKVSVAWGAENLYVAAESAVTYLKINGVKAALAENAKEVQIPFADLGITDLTKVYDFEIKIGTMSTAWTAKLIFDANVYNSVLPSKFTIAFGAEKLTDRLHLDTWNENGEPEATAGNRIYDTVYYNSATLKTDVSYTVPTVVEMDLILDKLPEVTTSPFVYSRWGARQSILNSVVIMVQDDLRAKANQGDTLITGLYNKAGKLYLVCPDNANQNVVEYEIGTYTAGGKYHLRMEYSYRKVSGVTVADVAYYVNGEYVGRKDDVYKANFNSRVSSGKAVQVFVNGSDATNVNNSAVISVLNVSTTQVNADVEAMKTTYTQAAEAAKTVIALINAIDENVTLDSEAAIQKAREEYEKLTGAAKTMVSNVEKLLQAEQKLKQLGNTYPHAMFAAAKMTWDGKTTETIYTRGVWLSETLKLSMAWDADYLYLAFTDANTPEISKLMIGGKTVTVNSENSKTSTGVLELRLALSELGIVDLTGKYPLAIQVGSLSWGGKMVFDTTSFSTSVLNPPTYGTRSDDRKAITIQNPTSRDTSYTNFNTAVVASVTAATVLEFDLDINKLPEDTTSYACEYPYVGKGLNFMMADDLVTQDPNGNVNQAFKFGFFLRDGVIQLGHATNGVHKFVPISETDNGRFHVRIEYIYNNDADHTVSAKYFINEVLVATGENVRVNTGNIGTKGKQRLLLKADAGVTDIAWSNVSVSKTNPNLPAAFVSVEDVIQAINAIGTVTLDKANAIQSARNAYDALDPAVKYMVTNLSVLVNAEKELNKLGSGNLHAVFAPESVVLDGKLDEKGYSRYLPLGTAKFGAAWDAKNLYLYFADTATPQITELKINGKAVTVNSENSKTTAGAREIRVDLKSLDITDLAATYSITFKLGTQTWAGKLVLDNVDFSIVPHGNLYSGAVSLNNKNSFKMDTWVINKDGDNNYSSFGQVVTEKLSAISGTSTVVEFDLAIEQMPGNYVAGSVPSRAFLNNGITVSIRDDKDTTGKSGMVFGIGKKNGELYLICWYYDAAQNANKKAEIPVGNEESCYVRVEYAYGQGTAVTAKYYINGLLIHTQENSYVSGASMGTATQNCLQIFALVPTANATATNKVVATVNNISVGHAQTTLAEDLSQKVPQVEELINKIGLPVTLDSRAAIEAAQEAYDKLSDLAKTQVTNLDVLENAKHLLQMLEKSYIHAAFSSEELVLDGKLFEQSYRMNVRMSETLKFGAAWTKEYLCLAFEGEKAPTVSELVINGKRITINSSNSKTGAVGREIRLSLSSLGITGYDKTYSISFRIGDIYWSGTLVQDSNDYGILPHGNLYYGAAGSSDKSVVVINTLTPSTDGNKTSSLAMFANEKFASVTGKMTIIDLDMVINNLPSNSTVASAPGRYFITGGVTFTYLDNLSPVVNDSGISEGLVFGFGMRNGELKLYYWYNDANGNAKLGSVDVPAAENYHLRVEYGNGNGKVSSVKIFINGLLLAEAASARVTAGTNFGTKAQNTLQIYARASLETEAARVDLRVSNVSASHPQILIIDDASAAANMDLVIDNIGTVTLDTTEKILAARELYNSLTTAQKNLVTKLAVLEAAEAKLRALKDQNNAQFSAYAFAEYTTETMTIDGVLNEKIWRTKQTIFGVGKLGMAWDFNYLYLTVTGSKVNTLKNLKINGVSVTDLGVTGQNIREMKILLSSVGIKAIDFEKTYELSFTLDGKTWEGQLVFDTGKYAVIKPSSTFWGGAKNGNDGVLKSQDSTRDGKRVGIIYDSTKLESTNGMTTIMEFDLKINAMPSNGYASGHSRNFVVGGISICIRDEDVTLGENGLGLEAFLVGLVRQKGNMYLVYWEDATQEYVYVLVDDYSTNNYHLRIEYDYRTNDDVSARYYVNGLLVAESHDAKHIAEGDGPYGTSAGCRIQVMAYATVDEPIDAAISDLSVSTNRYMENPDPRDEITKDAIFGTLDLNHVQKNLNLPTEYVTINGERYELVWATSDSSVVTAEGKVTRPMEETAKATLTLSIDGEERWAVTVSVDPMSLQEQESPEIMDAAFSKEPIVIDGILDDEGWRMSGRVLDRNKQAYAEYGFQWTQSYLYVAVEYLNGVDTLSLKLNGRYFTLQDGKLYRGGKDVGGSTLVVANGDIVEMRIPLSVLGLPSKIDSYGYTIPMSVKAGSYVGNGKVLRLSNIDWVVTVNRNQLTLGETIKTNDAYHGVQRLANGYRMFDLYGGSNLAKVRSYVYMYRTEEYYQNFSDRTYANRLEFDFYAEALPVLPTDGTAYRPTGGIYSVSGPTFTISDVAEADNYSNCCSFGIINTDGGLLFVLNVGGAVQTKLMNKQVKEKFSLAVEWASDDSLTVFIDGEWLTTFYGATARKSGSGDASLGINMYSFFEPQSVTDNYDVYITNIGFGKVHDEVNLLEQLDFDDIRGKNKTQEKITSDLILPTSITNGQLDKQYKITWTSNNPAVDAATGKVTRPQYGAAVVTLTATLSSGETKSFTVVVYGKKTQNDGVLHVLNDTNPATGIAVPSKDAVFTFDATNNSLVAVLDGETKINYVVLKDGDDRSRLVIENLTLWVSNDNQTYTRVKNFKLLQVGDKWYLYDFEASCKYIKVHYTQPDEEESSFIGTYGEMITAGYQKVFGADDSISFTQTQYVLTNNTGKAQRDYAWTISKKDLGITGNNASIRIYLDGKLLYHYVSGSNVVVRINDLEAGESVTLRVLSSTNGSVMDIANKEGVHEIIYGVRESTLSTTKNCYMTLPAGTTFPDGSKLEVETLYSYTTSGCHRSTDGGVTWETFAVKNNAPEGKEPVVAGSPGGWIFDSVTGRLMFECYRSIEKVTDENHLHTMVIASDDGGKTWYLQYTMPCRVCMDAYKGDNTIPNYALSYSDGIQLSTYDGKGKNVDFVFPMGYSWDNSGNFACYICYTTDAGDTWHYSSNPVTYPSTYLGTEGGCSEGWIIERSDGVLVLQVRCQDQACIHFKVSYSYDKGITWTNENIYTDFYAVNGQAYIKFMEVNGETTLISAWAGNSSLGGDTYHRNPFVFAASANEGETFRNIQNITFRSFEERYEDIYTPNTTNIYLAKVGDNLIFNYNRNRKGDKVNTIIEDFDDWFTRTKGGYDNFEHGTVRYEGWQKVYGNSELSTEIAQGNYSMKLGYDAKVVRSVPYLQDGKVSVDIYVPAGGSFTFELQSGHTRYYNSVSVPIAFRAEGGKIYFGDDTVPSADGIKEGWNTLVFDLTMTKDRATLSINGGAAVYIPLKMDFDDYINFITIGSGKDVPIYVDEVLVISDLEADVAVTSADKQAAAEVVELIKRIKTSGNRDAAIKAARAAFDQLTQAQQDLVDMRVLANNGKSGLDGMINYYDQLRLAEDGALVVEQLINEIGEVTYVSNDAIKAAEVAYNTLTSAQKKQVRNYETLRVARLKYERIVAHKAYKDQEAAQVVQDMIDSIILTNAMRHEKKITDARKAYKLLSSDQLALVDVRKLYQAELKLIEAKKVEAGRRLASMQQLINSLDNITLEMLPLVEGLRTTFNKLTAEEKSALNDQKLVRAEQILRELKANVEKKTLDEIRINGLMAYIDSIGTVTIEKKALIDSIRASYDKLTEKQQERVKNYETFAAAEGLVQSMIQLTDAIPNTGEPATRHAETLLMPVMLVCALAMAALVIVPKKRKRR